MLKDFGIAPIRTPYQAQNAHAYAERFVLSIKSECLSRIIFLGEASLRRAIREYGEYYHVERAHQGIGNLRLSGLRETASPGPARCHERLGGILKS